MRPDQLERRLRERLDALGPAPLAELLRSVLLCVVMSGSLQGCTSSAINTAADSPEPTAADSPGPSAAPAGVTLVLVAAHASDGCCRVFTVNPGEADARVNCMLVALDPDGRLVYSGRIPGNPLSRFRRFSGFDAPPGRHGYGVIQLPIDLAHDSYTAPCRPAAWHGGAPI
jgi:hypothetical protein